MIKLDTEQFIAVDVVIRDRNIISMRQCCAADGQRIVSHVLAGIDRNTLAVPYLRRVPVICVAIDLVLFDGHILRMERKNAVTVIRDNVVPNRNVLYSQPPPTECEVCGTVRF